MTVDAAVERGEAALAAPRRLLLLASEFPPLANAGVYRPLYFARYLPRFGWEPTVLTVKDVAHFSYDASLLDKLPPECTVHRTETLELRRLLWLAHRALGRSAQTSQAVRMRPGVRELGRSLRKALFVPDDRILWLPFAVARALRLQRQRPFDVVAATIPAYSTALAAHLISRLTGLPLVVDMRDPWSADPYEPGATPAHRALNRWLERRTLTHASRIVVICEDMKHQLLRRYPEFDPRKVVVVTNGFDRDELAAAEPLPRGDAFVVMYYGSLYVDRIDAFDSVCRAWMRASSASAGFREHAQMWIVGRADPEMVGKLAEYPDIKVKLYGHQPHAEAVRYLVTANMLMLLVRDHRSEHEFVITVPGKLFEYLASGAPILMVGPESDAARIIRATSAGPVHRESDVVGIAESLVAAYGAEQQPDRAAALAARQAYDREKLTGALARELEAVAAHRSLRSPTD